MSDSATLWTVVHQAPLSMGQEHWVFLPVVGCCALLQGIFLTQGLNLRWQMDCLPPVPPGSPSFLEFSLNLTLSSTILLLLDHQGCSYCLSNKEELTLLAHFEYFISVG